MKSTTIVCPLQVIYKGFVYICYHKRSLLQKILFFLLCSYALFARSQDITFNYLTTDNGLSQFTVYSLYTDENGLIWIGTRDGVNIYNGNQMKIFKPERENPNSLVGNVVRQITGNGKGLIYILTSEGLNSYNKHTEQFTLIALQKDYGSISSVVCNGDEIYFGAGRKIYKYTEQQTIETAVELPVEIRISSLLQDKEGRFWIGSRENGVYVLPEELTGCRQIISYGNVYNLYQDSTGDIWVCTWEEGIYCVSGEKVTNYCFNGTLDNKSISSNSVRTCCEDNQGNIWIGTFLGLDKFNRKDNTFTHYASSDVVGSLNNSSVYCIIKDHQGTLWIGTYFGGVNYFNPEYEIYTYYKNSIYENEGLSFPVVGAITEDKDGNIWIATEGGGLNKYNPVTGKFTWYRHQNNRNSISQNNIKSLYYDEKRDAMWIGTHQGGLNKLNLKTGHFTLYDLKNVDERSNNVICHIIPFKDELMIATHSGVKLFNPDTGKFTQLLDLFSHYLLVDSRDILWVAVEGNGVFAYNFDTKETNHYVYQPGVKGTISDKMITYITEDRHHNLWFATAGNGIDLYNITSNTFENFNSRNNGLGSDCVYTVRESQNGQLLLTTNQGFSLFDYYNKSFHNYNYENGFPFTTLNENSLYQARNGKIYLGGIKGMVSFYEKNLNIIPKPYDILPYRLLVNGNEVTVGDETGILPKSLYDTYSIVLKSNHSVFSFEFATSNYISANKDEIRYRLEGFSNEWTSTRGQQVITYTNLSPGNYNLVIKANGINKPYQPEYRLSIKVLPPFYKTTWAYLIYFLTAVSLLYYLIKMYKGRIELQESLKYEKQRIKDVEELNQSKLRFFTNISHEFRTPLTIIIGQIEMLLQVQSFTPTIYNKILNIYKNGLQLRELIGELLDFRKQEQGHMKIKVSRHNLVEFLYENYLLYVEYAATRHVRFNFTKETDELPVWYDGKQLQKVINNLLSNAFKYTPEGGEISINVKKQDNNAVIEVKDSGAGISPQEIGQIFNRFYQIETGANVEGTGLGLALSKGIVELHHGTIAASSGPGEGTLFTITLQLGNSHFAIGQIEKEENKSESLTYPEEISFLQEQQIMDAPVKERIKGARMLIVEDNNSLRNMLAGLFEPYYEVILAADGEEGLNKAKETMPDIIVSDIVMPRMTGTELCKQIKSDFATCHIPVVLLTARTAIEHTIEGLRIGADDYITKPFNVNLLVSRCNNLVNSRIVLQEKYSKQPQTKVQMLATNPMDKDLLDRAVAIIEKNLDNVDFCLNDLIKELCISRTNFFQKMKAITGQSPSEFILTIRLKKAAYLLKNDLTKNISEISDCTGFSSPRYFGRCFKDVYHVTPLSYRKGSPEVETEEGENN